MSALSNPSPLQQPPQRVTPAVVPEPPREPRPWKGWLIFGLIVAAGAAGYQLWLKPRQEAAARQAATVVYRTAKVTVGPFQRTMRASGVTGARLYANITAPRLRGFESRSQMELLNLVKNGVWIKKGDTLAQIDPGYLVDHVDDIKASIEQAGLDVDKRIAEQGVETETLNQTLRVAKAQADKAALDNKAAEVRTEVERELLKLSLDEAQARYKQSQLDVPQKKLIHEAELKILGFTKERHVRHRDRHTNDIKAYTVISPMEGMVVLSTVFRGGGESQQVQQGDQLNSGQPLAKIVNPSSMQLEGNVNQAEATDIRVGQKVYIGLDAFPGLKFQGKVYSIGALAVGGWRQNYFIRSVPLKFTIDGADQRLIPDLSGFADIVVEEKDRATLVPVNAIQKDGSKSYVYVKQGDQWNKREVALGASNNTHVIALSGLSGDEEVRLLD